MLVKFEQNCMVETIRNFKLFDKKNKNKNKNENKTKTKQNKKTNKKQKHYLQSADAILEDISELKQLFNAKL